jgi:hypothetical protein
MAKGLSSTLADHVRYADFPLDLYWGSAEVNCVLPP